MNRRLWRALTAALSVFLLMIAAYAAAQPPKTASEFYMQYRRAFDAAGKIEELLPYMSVSVRKQVEATPPADRPEMFGMVKMIGTLTDVTIVKDVRTATDSTLTVDAIDSDGKKIVGTIHIVKEGGAFKLGEENWTNK
jgi:hypothetical protein